MFSGNNSFSGSARVLDRYSADDCPLKDAAAERSITLHEIAGLKAASATSSIAICNNNENELESEVFKRTTSFIILIYNFLIYICFLARAK